MTITTTGRPEDPAVTAEWEALKGGACNCDDGSCGTTLHPATETAGAEQPTVRTRRKKAVTVDTLLWNGANADQLAAFTGGRFWPVGPDDRTEFPDITGEVLDVLHSTRIGMRTGQHVVKGVRGEFYPIDESVLDETYEDAMPIADDIALIKAVEAYVRSLGWDIETSHRDVNDDVHDFDFYVWPAKAGV